MVRGREMKKSEDGTKRVPDIATTCTLIWTADGRLVVVGHPEEITTIHERYEDAEKAFLACIEAIKDGKRYHDDPYKVGGEISTALELVKRSFEMRMLYDEEGLKSFLTTTILSVQFSRVGKKAYVLHNMETFKFLSDLSEIGILVPELFLATPKIPRDPAQPFRDPEILRMLEQMKKKETP